MSKDSASRSFCVSSFQQKLVNEISAAHRQQNFYLIIQILLIPKILNSRAASFSLFTGVPSTGIDYVLASWYDNMNHKMLREI